MCLSILCASGVPHSLTHASGVETGFARMENAEPSPTAGGFCLSFPSFSGNRPLDLGAVLKKKIKPAFQKVGIVGVGWYTFRDTVGNHVGRDGRAPVDDTRLPAPRHLARDQQIFAGHGTALFELAVPCGECLPVPAHSHDHYEETVYGVEGVLTWTVNGKANRRRTRRRALHSARRYPAFRQQRKQECEDPLCDHASSSTSGVFP